VAGKPVPMRAGAHAAAAHAIDRAIVRGRQGDADQ
jgi:hypothetical protein